MTGSKLSALALLSILAFSPPAAAQKIYKCADGNGGNTYQQVPCPEASDTKSVRSFKRQPDAPRDFGQYRQELVATPRATLRAAVMNTGPSMSTGGIAGQPSESTRRCENLLTLGDRATYRALCTSGGNTAVNTSAPERDVQPPPQPTRFVDERGRTVRAVQLGPNLYKDRDTGKKHRTFDRGDGVQQAVKRPIDAYNEVGEALDLD